MPGEQVVLLSQVLADEINAGYQGMHDVEVRAVNGERVENSVPPSAPPSKKPPARFRLTWPTTACWW